MESCHALWVREARPPGSISPVIGPQQKSRAKLCGAVLSSISFAGIPGLDLHAVEALSPFGAGLWWSRVSLLYAQASHGILKTYLGFRRGGFVFECHVEFRAIGMIGCNTVTLHRCFAISLAYSHRPEPGR